MSSQTYFEHIIARIPAEHFGATEDQFIQLTLDGDARTYNWQGQNVRSWHINAFGSAAEIMAGAICHANTFNSGVSTWKSKGRSGYLKPQQWIRKVRTAIANSQEWLPDLFNIEFGTEGRIYLEGKNELKGASHSLIVRALYDHAIAQAKEGADWPRFWHIASARGPGER